MTKLRTLQLDVIHPDLRYIAEVAKALMAIPLLLDSEACVNLHICPAEEETIDPKERFTRGIEKGRYRLGSEGDE